jgi:hypothetical protein
MERSRWLPGWAFGLNHAPIRAAARQLPVGGEAVRGRGDSEAVVAVQQVAQELPVPSGVIPFGGFRVLVSGPIGA